MDVLKILQQWSEMCADVGIEWYLDRETLLCADGLEQFPTELEQVQVRVNGKYRDSIRKISDQMPEVNVAYSDDLRAGGTVHCADQDWPVFLGYQEYLSETYGDYQNGLTDDIGVGLTAEEKTELRAHQSRCVEALRFLQELSEAYDLRYYLLAGSVLGAVRHGGFIPWDDDIDVGIRTEDIGKLEKAVRENMHRMPEGFEFKQRAVGNPYPRMFSKICYKGRCCIDLWPLVPTYSDGFRAELIWYLSKLATKAHYENIGYKNYKNRKIGQILGFFLHDTQALGLAEHIERRYIGTNAPAYINLYSIYSRKKETIQCRWLNTPAKADFAGVEVPVIGCTEEYLTHLYGDFRKLPAPWKRASRHFERF